jgi:hypothetical protein
MKSVNGSSQKNAIRHATGSKLALRLRAAIEVEGFF